MSNNLGVLTTISTAIFGLFSVLTTSACDDPDDPTQRAAFIMTDDEDALESALDWVGAPTPQEIPPPADFHIEKVTTNGKGCPGPDSVSILLALNKTLLRIIYDDMILEQSPGQAVQTTSCTTVLKLQIPAGWRVAPRIVRTRGYAYLEKKIKARRNSNMFFAGVPVGTEFDTNLQGPFDDIYQVIDLVPPSTTAWSSCGGSALFSISNSLVLNATGNTDGNALMTLHDQRLVSWQFKKC